MSAGEADTATGFVVDFALYGGAFDGTVMAMNLKPAADKVYLVEGPAEEDGTRAVWAYAWADRTDRKGRWVLQAVQWVGFRGVPREGKTES